MLSMRDVQRGEILVSGHVISHRGSPIASFHAVHPPLRLPFILMPAKQPRPSLSEREGRRPFAPPYTLTFLSRS